MDPKIPARPPVYPPGEVNHQEQSQKRRHKTRKPRPVRPIPPELDRAQRDAMPAVAHTAPVLAVRAVRKGATQPGGLDLLMTDMQDAIDTCDWRHLGTLLGTMREQNFRLDELGTTAPPSVDWVVRRAPAEVLDADEGDSQLKARLALGLLERGCNPAAMDAQGRKVLDRIIASAGDEWLSRAAADYPAIRKLLAGMKREKD